MGINMGIDYKINIGQTELEIAVQVSNIHWENDGIGWYEYCGSKEFDKGTDYIEEFEIDEIWIDTHTHTGLERINPKICRTCKILYEFIKSILEDDIEFRKKLEKEYKEFQQECNADKKFDALRDRNDKLWREQ